jgi:predicted ester cyclase
MSPEDLKTRARRFAQEILTQGDLAVSDELFAPGCAHHGIAPGPRGSAAVQQWVATLRRAFPDLRAMVEEEIVDGTRVVERLALAGTHRGEFLGVPPTGRHVEWPVVTIVHGGIAGTFTEHWMVWDRLDILRQIGATLPGTEALPGPTKERTR